MGAEEVQKNPIATERVDTVEDAEEETLPAPTGMELARLQRGWLKQLQEVSEERVEVQHDEGKLSTWHDWQTCKDRGCDNRVIIRRSILRNEVLFDFDPPEGMKWGAMVVEVEKLERFLSAHGIPSQMAVTFGRGMHNGIFFDPSSIEIPDDIRNKVREYGLNVDDYTRNYLYEVVVENAKLDAKILDRAQVSWRKRSMLRCMGCPRDGGYKTLVDQVPLIKPKPRDLPLRFPEKITLRNLSVFREEILAKVNEEVERLEKGAEIDYEKLKGVKLDDFPCLKRIAEGNEQGSRYMGALSLGIMGKECGLDAGSLREVINKYASMCAPGHDTEYYTRVVGDVFAREIHFSCRAVKLLFGKEICQAKRCAIWRDGGSEGANYCEHWLGDSIGVRHYPDKISFVRYGKDGAQTERIVVDGPLEMRETIVVDGAPYYRVNFNGGDLVLNLRNLTRRLRDMGRVWDKRNLDDALSAIISDCKSLKTANATFGVYIKDNGGLYICDSPVPVEAEQKKVWTDICDLVGRRATADEIQQYIDFLDFWHPFEIVPAFGIGFAAPFALLLRSQGWLFPHVFHYAPEPDLGKSLAGLAVSERAWGVSPATGPGIDSVFRLGAHLDSACLPRTVDEADHLSEKFWPILKESAERRVARQSGTQERDLIDYLSRMVLILTGNAHKISSDSILKRFLLVRYDSSAKAERQSMSAEVDALFNKLEVIGFQILRWGIERWSAYDVLMDDLAHWEKDIRSEMPSSASPKRPQAWACVYFGLKIFENGCQHVGVNWTAPCIPEFVGDVVVPIEESTWSYRRVQAEVFASWFKLYEARNTRVRTIRDEFGEETHIPQVNGESEIFKKETIIVNGVEYSGVWVTNSLLDDYNKGRQDETRIPSLVELGRQTADVVGIPRSSVLTPNGDAKVKNLGKEHARAVFVLDGLLGEPERISSLDDFDQEEKVNTIRGILTGEATKEGQEKRLVEALGLEWPRWMKHLLKEGLIVRRNPDAPWKWMGKS